MTSSKKFLQVNFLLFSLIFFLFGCADSQKKLLEEQEDDSVEYRQAIINLKGEYLVPPIYDLLYYHKRDKSIEAYKKMPPPDSNSWKYYLNIKGHIIKSEYVVLTRDWKETFQDTSEDIRIMQDHPYELGNIDHFPMYSYTTKKYGFVNKKGSWVIDPQWDFVEGFKNGISYVWNDSKPFRRYGLINEKGEYLLKPTACVNLEPIDTDLMMCRIPFSFRGKQL